MLVGSAFYWRYDSPNLIYTAWRSRQACCAGLYRLSNQNSSLLMESETSLASARCMRTSILLLTSLHTQAIIPIDFMHEGIESIVKIVLNLFRQPENTYLLLWKAFCTEAIIHIDFMHEGVGSIVGIDLHFLANRRRSAHNSYCHTVDLTSSASSF